MNRWIVVLMMVGLLAVSGCSAFDFLTTSANASNQRITTPTFDGVIFSAQNAEQLGLQFNFNERIDDYWTPTESNVTALEAGIIPFLETQVAPDDSRYGFWQSLPSYIRQYFGLTFEGGQPLVYANYFCMDYFDDWLEDFVIVMDGGECFFQVLYDPATGEYLDLRINGVA